MSVVSSFTIKNWRFRITHSSGLNLIYEGPHMIKGFLSTLEIEEFLDDPRKIRGRLPFPKYTMDKLIKQLQMRF